MATRSRRSAGGGDAPNLNPTMIQLLDTARLKKELVARGLATTGSKQMLADRLSDAVLLGKTVEDAPPALAKPAPKTQKRKSMAAVKTEVPEETFVPCTSNAVAASGIPSTTEVEAPMSTVAVKTEPSTTSVSVETSGEKPASAKGKGKTAAQPKRKPAAKAKPAAPAPAPAAKRRKTVKSEPEPQEEEDEDEDVPLASFMSPKAQKSSVPVTTEEEKRTRPNSRVMRLPPPDIENFDEDLPFLSQLPKKKVDVPPAASPSTSESSTSQHAHGTRSKAVKTTVVPVAPRVEQTSQLLSSDDFAHESSPVRDSPRAVPRQQSPIPLAKGDSDWRPEEKPKVRREKQSSTSEEKPGTFTERRSSLASEKSRPPMRPAPPPDRKTITHKWAEKVAEHKRAQAASQSQSITSPKPAGDIGEKAKSLVIRTDVPDVGEKSVRSPDLKRPLEGAAVRKDSRGQARPIAKPRPSDTAASSSNDLLGSIMVDQSELLGEKKRKLEEEEREREKIREERERRLAAAMQQHHSAPQAAQVSPLPLPLPSMRPRKSSLVPPPPPPKKSLPPPPLVPPPPPPKKEVKPTPPAPVFVPIEPEVPPPPPPPLASILASVKVEAPPSRSKVVPPPPPKGPLPTHVQLEKEKRQSSRESSRHSSFSTPKRDSKTASPKVAAGGEKVPAKGETQLVESVTQALLLVLERRKKQQEEDRAVQECLSSIISRVEQAESRAESTENVPSTPSGSRVPKSFREKAAEAASNAENDEEMEEYDPFETTTVDESFISDYVPSAVRPARARADSEGESEAGSASSGEQNDEENVDEERFLYGDNEDEEMEEGEEGAEKERDGESVQILERERAPAGGEVPKENKKSVEELLQNPRDLLKRASAVLESFNKPKEPEVVAEPVPEQYFQMPLQDDYEEEEEEKPAPDYHGEPVPSDDDDMLFEIAAGISKPKKKKEVVIEEEKLPSDETIEPDYYNADLHIKGATDKNWLIEPENADGLALMWGGVRANYGIRLPFRDVRNCPSETEDKPEEMEDANGSMSEKPPSGQKASQIVFQAKITEFLSTKHLPFEENDPHDIRIGFSLRTAPNILGEFMSSYCITSLGKKATCNEFTDYGIPFHQNDVVTACIDLSERTISYWVNDLFQGVAFKDIRLPDGDAVYPHVCVKNCSVAVNFGDFPEGEDAWRSHPDWRFPTSLGRGDLERSPKAPDSKADCTVLMMVGLPGVGKTTWVRAYLRDHPNEQWTVIESENVMAAMKVNGVSRKRAHHGRWDMVMGMIGKSLQRSVLLAARRRRNYIIDMTNTSRDVRKRRLQLFEEFRRKCVVLIPSDEEMLERQSRQARQEGTAMMPPEAMLEMKAQMSIPSSKDEPLEDIYFVEPPIQRVQDAINLVARYNEEARPWFQKKFRRRRAQNVGLGPDRDYHHNRDNDYKRPTAQPLTVLPPLRVSITSLDESSPNNNQQSPSPLRSGGPVSAGPLSSTGTGSVDFSVPPPAALAGSANRQTHDPSVPPPSIPSSTASNPATVPMNVSVPPPSNPVVSTAAVNGTVNATTKTDFSKPPRIGDAFKATPRRASQDLSSMPVVDTSLPPPAFPSPKQVTVPPAVKPTVTLGVMPTVTPTAKPTVSVPVATTVFVPTSTVFATPPPMVASTPAPSSAARSAVRIASIQDLPPPSIPGKTTQGGGLAGQGLYRPPPTPPVFEEILKECDLDEEELRELRESNKSSNANPVVAEAVMRAKLKALQMKKMEKRTQSAAPISVLGSKTPATIGTAVPATTSQVTEVVRIEITPKRPQVGANSIPTIGSRTPISVDTTPRVGPQSPSLPSGISPIVRLGGGGVASSPLATPTQTIPTVVIPSPVHQYAAPPPQMMQQQVTPTQYQYQQQPMQMDYGMAPPQVGYNQPPPSTSFNLSMPPPMMNMNMPPPEMPSAPYNMGGTVYSPLGGAGNINWNAQRKSSG